MRHLSDTELYKVMLDDKCPGCGSNDRQTMDTTIDEVIICGKCDVHVKVYHDTKTAIMLNGV